MQRETSARSSVNLRLEASRFDPQQNIRSDNYTATVGWRHRVSERFSFSTDLGVRRVESDVNSDQGFVFGLRGNLATERGGFAGAIERSVLPSAYGDVVEADRLNLSYARAISERMALRFSSRAYRTRRAGGSRGRDRSFFSAGPSLSYQLAPAWAAEVSYSYQWVDRQNDPRSFAGNSYGLSLIYRPPSRL